MRPIIKTQTGTGQSAPIGLDRKQAPFSVGFGAVVSGTATYTIQHTFDDIYAAAPVTWFNHPFVASATASADGNYAYPVTAIRISIASGTGSVTLTVLQGMR